MFRLLAKSMGYQDDYFDKTEEEIFEELLEKSLKDVKTISEEDKAILKQGGSISTPFANHMDIKTKSGKIQITNDGTINGRIIDLILLQPVAPSIEAASRTSWLRPVKPAM